MISSSILNFNIDCLKTGVWLELQAFNDSFMTPLRLDLNMSKAHYQAELSNAGVKKKNANRGETLQDHQLSSFIDSICHMTVFQFITRSWVFVNQSAS